MPKKLSVINAIFPHGDADCVTVADTKESAVAVWRKYMNNGDVETDKDKMWLDEQANNLLTVGITDKQDSGVFYRLNPMIQS